MLLRVLAIGKLKDPRLVGLCDEYVKRSKPRLPIERSICRSAQEQWNKAGQDHAVVVVLDERGELPDSLSLAQWIESWAQNGRRRADFLIGDSKGYSDIERARADHVLALSRLTLPHRLAQLMLCEQLYRAGTIMAGHPYHHA